MTITIIHRATPNASLDPKQQQQQQQQQHWAFISSGNKLQPTHSIHLIHTMSSKTRAKKRRQAAPQSSEPNTPNTSPPSTNTTTILSSPNEDGKNNQTYQTKVWKVDPSQSNFDDQLKEAAQLLRQNEVVGFPTETVYGLGGNACSDEAISKIFRAKGRPSDNPLIVHVSSHGMFEPLVTHVSNTAKKLIDKFWPGPLTVVLTSSGVVSKLCTAGCLLP